MEVAINFSFGHYAGASYIFHMKDGSKKCLKDGFSFDFGDEAAFTIEAFLKNNGYARGDYN